MSLQDTIKSIINGGVGEINGEGGPKFRKIFGPNFYIMIGGRY